MSVFSRARKKNGIPPRKCERCPQITRSPDNRLCDGCAARQLYKLQAAGYLTDTSMSRPIKEKRGRKGLPRADIDADLERDDI